MKEKDVKNLKMEVEDLITTLGHAVSDPSFKHGKMFVDAGERASFLLNQDVVPEFKRLAVATVNYYKLFSRVEMSPSKPMD